MLAIRLQRTGRKGHAQFRVIVQDAARSPKSGRVVTQLGHYNPHTKNVVIDKEKAVLYLNNGAQPSPRVVSLLKAEKVKLPDWVEKTPKKKREIRNPDKLRRNRPVEAEAPAPEAPAVEAAEPETSADKTQETAPAPAEEAAPAEGKPAETEPATEEVAETPAEEAPAEEAPAETPAEEKPEEPVEAEKSAE